MEPQRPPGSFYGQTQERRRCADLVLSESTYALDCRTERHFHEADLFYFVVQGQCHETAQGYTRTHGPSALVFLPAGEPHATHWRGSAGVCFHMEFSPAWKDRLQVSGLRRGICCPDGLPRWLATRLHGEFRHGDALSPLCIEGLALEMVAETARRAAPHEAQTPYWLRAVRDRLHDECALSFSLENLARDAGVAPAHLARLFRRAYGCTAGEYVRHLRVEHACRLLKSGEFMPLGVIAHRLGFADQSHFTRVFRRVTGMTPAQFRNARAALPERTNNIISIQDKPVDTR